ncbi:MAG: multicopper oxidase domain-containing protein [Deltaproteobacteria bacterium]|nr:multicopper oxidase domain-containing protein [Deltaproteobacteria bacterium]MBW2417998.1 multicopper oxidase domain-containing protein [Deltaproteobacteria bacterium]
MLLSISVGATAALAQAAPGGSLDPLTIPKYVTPLVIPPVMNDDGVANSYDIAVRQFRQQILPGGIWNTLNGRNDQFPATPVWSYGPAADPTPAIAPDPGSQFNYPAYTVESHSEVPVAVEWRNELVADPQACNFASPVGDSDCDYLPHLLSIDQTLHWANPPMDCRDGSTRTDCSGDDPAPYDGPVPIVTHVHGAHVDPHSDGYPEAWWLPAAGNIPAGYATQGTLYDDANGGSGDRGVADYVYRQDQPATTLWYHDHSLGMTRSNVYAGPAGFWLVRGRAGHEATDYDVVIDGKKGGPATLPGPAPVAGQGVLDLNVPGSPVRNRIREIPIVIQDRSFNADGSLFYPDNRAFFEFLNAEGTAGTPAAQFPGEGELQIDFVPDSDIAPIWNPEAFFNVMVVNGVSWPTLDVAPARYRFRLLNGCNSRFLNLSLRYPEKKNKPDGKKKELPFIQIGADQGYLPQAVEILTGFATPLQGSNKKPKPQDRVAAPDPQQALLMSLAERADVIVDFSDLRDGTVITMINTAPDAPFGGFPDVPADPNTTGQVMQFVVNSAVLQPSDQNTTKPYRLVPVAEGPPGAAVVTRQVSLNEGESEEVCVADDGNGNLVQVMGSHPPDCAGGGEPFGPKEALLGQVDLSDPDDPSGIPLKWTDSAGAPVSVQLQSGASLTVNVTENPIVGDTEDWEIYNFTEDAHPIHLHLVRFQVISREAIPGHDPVAPQVLPSETGYKDTVIAYPGEITKVRALFDIEGLYVWHCHIVEHEDNEMMRPYVVSAPPAP